MGRGIVTECTTCHNQESYTFGIGMEFWDLDNIITSFPYGVRKKIKELEKQYAFEGVSYSYGLFECTHCDTAHSRLSLEIKYAGGLVYKPQYKCYECKRNLKPSSRKVDSFKCRKCRSYELKETGDLMWD